MCLAVPAKIKEIKGHTATVDFGGTQREVSISLVPQVKKGEYVLVHAGFAIEILSQKEAKETLDVFEEIYKNEH
ncbi:MAG: HypC/HybG/HupF family hydrogenase formation chaperone [Elusimicrobia bacterium]|nr:HypC/HybG/HupF family hydrogenase formation chaperone [Elusimicrobiota bacterium]